MTTTELIDLKIRYDKAYKGFETHYEADNDTCEKIAASFNMNALESLKARIETKPLGNMKPKTALKIWITAKISQICGVTLEAFSNDIDSKIAITLIESAYLSDEILDIGAQELGLSDLNDPDVIDDGIIDLGQYIIEALSIAFDPYARKPGAVFSDPELEKPPSPFAVLIKLVPKS